MEILVPRRNIFTPRQRQLRHFFDFQHLSPDGDVLWEDYDVPNELVDEGESDMLDVYYRSAAEPAAIFGRLYNDTPVDTDTLATLTGEVTGTGYAAVQWNTDATDFPTLALDAGDFRVSGVQRTYTAGGAWTAATVLVLATVGTGTAGLFIAWVALSTTRTLADGDSLNVTPRVKLA